MRSMTGYANFTSENDLFKLAIEIKSVNNKNLNLKVKIPYILNFLENTIKTQVSNEINRGSVDLRIEFEDKREVEELFSFDKNSAKAYMKLLDNMEKEFKLKFDNKLETLLKAGNVVKKVDLAADETLYTSVMDSQEKTYVIKCHDNINLQRFSLEDFENQKDILFIELDKNMHL